MPTNNNTATDAVVYWQCLPNICICRNCDSLEDADNDANTIVKMCHNGIKLQNAHRLLVIPTYLHSKSQGVQRIMHITTAPTFIHFNLPLKKF
jgi:hypothetical protein